MQKTAIDRYEEIVTDALMNCSAKLLKSFKSAVITTLILYMVLPRKINSRQMGRYSQSCEQRFRQTFECEFDCSQWIFIWSAAYGMKMPPYDIHKTGYGQVDVGVHESRERKLILTISTCIVASCLMLTVDTLMPSEHTQ